MRKPGRKYGVKREMKVSDGVPWSHLMRRQRSPVVAEKNGHSYLQAFILQTLDKLKSKM